MTKQERIGSVLALAVGVFGAALLQSAKWVMLNDGTGFTTGALYLSRAAGIACFALCAIAFRDRLPLLKNAQTVAIALMVVYLAAMLATLVLPSEEIRTVLFYAAGLLFGIADALFTLLFLTLFSRYSPKHSALLIVTCELLTNALMIVLTALSPTALFYARLCYLVLALVLLPMSFRRLLFPGGKNDAAALIFPGDTALPDTSKVDFYPASISGWVLFLVTAATLFNLFGTTAQVSSLTGDSYALYDNVTGVVLVLLDVLLLLYLAFQGDRFTFELAVLVCATMYMLSFVIYGYMWQQGNPVAGVVLRTGYDFGCVLFKAIVARKAFQCPRRSFAYFGLFCACTTLYPGRALGYVLVNNLDQATLVPGLAQVFIMVVFVLVVAVLLFSGVTRGTGIIGGTAADNAADVLSATDAQPAQAERAAAQAPADAVADRQAALENLAREFNLTARETEVFVELVNGRTRTYIADKYYISPETVKGHISHIYMKAGVSTKQELLNVVEERLNGKLR